MTAEFKIVDFMTDRPVSILTTTKDDTPACTHFFVNGRSNP